MLKTRRKPASFDRSKRPLIDPATIGPANQHTLVCYDPFMIAQLPGASESLKETAIVRDYRAIAGITNPSLSLQRKAIGYSEGRALRYIVNPDPAIVKSALNLAPEQGAYLANPTTRQLHRAVRSDASVIEDMPEANMARIHKRVLHEIVTDNVWLIRYISNPDEDLQMAVVRVDPSMIEAIDEPTDAVRAVVALLMLDNAEPSNS